MTARSIIDVSDDDEELFARIWAEVTEREQIKAMEEFRRRWNAKDFDPDQPRDEGGRWTAGGGGGGGIEAPATESGRQAREIEQQIDGLVRDPNVTTPQQKDATVRALVARLEDNAAFKEYAESGGYNRMVKAIWDKSENGPAYAAADSMVHQWAGTSGDHDSDAVNMQRAINAEFNLDAKTDHMTVTYSRHDANYERDAPAMRAFARAMYDNTQEQLKDAGIERMLVYRGMSFDSVEEARAAGFPPAATLQTQTATVSQQPASSWSYNPDVAVAFASGTRTAPGTVFAAEVPASRVLATPASGFGCRAEAEVVILGSASDQVNHLTGSETITGNDVRVNIFEPGQQVFKTLAQIERKEFDPDQPRDEGGKWTSNGGGAVGGPPVLATGAPVGGGTHLGQAIPLSNPHAISAVMLLEKGSVFTIPSDARGFDTSEAAEAHTEAQAQATGGTTIQVVYDVPGGAQPGDQILVNEAPDINPNVIHVKGEMLPPGYQPPAPEVIERPSSYQAARSIEDAANFTKGLGVKYTHYEERDLAVVNEANRQLFEITEKNPALVMPNTVAVGSNPDDSILATYNRGGDYLELNRNGDWSNARATAQDMANRGYWSDGEANHVLTHELAHLQHASNVESQGGTVRANQPWSGPDTLDQQAMAARVSTYAAAAPDEFVAETYTAMLNGKTFGSDVMDLYHQYNGPPLPTRPESQKTWWRQWTGYEDKAFDENQPRDENGRWTAGGGGGTLSAPDKSTTAEGLRQEQDRLERALNNPSLNQNHFKGTISRQLAARLDDNAAFKDYAASQNLSVQEAAGRLANMWAGSSGGSNVLAVSMQKAINDEFGLGARTEHMPVNSPTVSQVYEEDGAAYRAFARAVYDNTQAELKSQGIESLTVYRGMRFQTPEAAQAAGFETDGQPREAQVSQQPASSWSYDYRTAYKFSGGRIVPGAVMAAEVPASRVFSTLKTGPGAKNEQEVIVLGGTTDTVAVQAWGNGGGAPTSPEALIQTKLARWWGLETKALEQGRVINNTEPVPVGQRLRKTDPSVGYAYQQAPYGCAHCKHFDARNELCLHPERDNGGPQLLVEGTVTNSGCCHQEGTLMRDPDSGVWQRVEDHPSACLRGSEHGYAVRLWGVPYEEVVTADHRYWVRRRTSRDRGTGSRRWWEVEVSSPDWAYAPNLDRYSWIGAPIDQIEAVEDADTLPFMDDPGWWWLIGYWWGDGWLERDGNKILVTIANNDPETLARFTMFLREHGCPSHVIEQRGCLRFVFSHKALAMYLRRWYLTHEKRGQKCPPLAVEHLPRIHQAELLRGYIAADGHIEHKHWSEGISLVSVCYEGLLSARRMLARLEIASCIRASWHRAGPSTIQGRAVQVQQQYVLSFRSGASKLGYPLDKENPVEHERALVEDGWLWTRVRSVTPTSDQRRFIAVTTSSGDYVTDFGLSHNCDLWNTDDPPARTQTQQEAEYVQQPGTDFRCEDCIVFDAVRETCGWVTGTIRATDSCNKWWYIGWPLPAGHEQKEFDPDQPRDETGKWTANGAGAGAGSEGPLPPPPPGSQAARHDYSPQAIAARREAMVNEGKDQRTALNVRQLAAQAKFDRVSEQYEQAVAIAEDEDRTLDQATQQAFTTASDSFRTEMEQITQDRQALADEMREKYINAPEPATFYTPTYGPAPDFEQFNGDAPTNVTTGVAAVQAMIGQGAVSQGFEPVIMAEFTTGRSYHEHGVPQDYGGRVTLVENAETRSVVHEMGHAVEDGIQGAREAILAHIEERTRGEPLQSLAQLTGRNYGEAEMTRPDLFADPYMGKDYGTDATEFLSMSLAFMYTDPVGFARDDPDSYDFAIGLLAEARANGGSVEAKTQVKEFDPDQPRDEGGKWTADGGGGVSQPSPPPSATAAGPTLASLNIAPKDSYRRAAERDIEGWLEEVADTTGRTPEQVRANVEDNMQRYMDGAELKTRTSVEAFEKIFAPGGRFENQLETGKLHLGGSIFDPSGRSSAERNAFGVGRHADEHPKYAFLDNPAAPSLDAKDYGNVEITFKEAVKDRTTITFGDSLSPMLRTAILPQPATAPADFRAAADQLPMLAEPNLSLQQISDQIGYVDAQIHGPNLTADDVESVRFDPGAASPEQMARLIQMAQARGVEVKRLSNAKLAVKEFDPNQPRDESGKWTSDGGGAGSGGEGGAGEGPQPPPPPRPTSTGATLKSLGIKPTPEYERHATRTIDDFIEDRAREFDTTPEQIKADVEATMAKYMKDSKLCMNVPLEAFEKIFAPGGKFENQHATGTSHGDYAPDRRSEAERNAFGVSGDADNFPKYGYVQSPRDPYHPWRMAAGYGAVQITFKDEVKERATVTFGDSLYALEDADILPMPMSGRPDYRATVDVDTLAIGSTPEEINATLSYVEAQIHGPDLTVADVESVHFDRQTSTVARAEQSGEIMRYIKLARDNGVKVV